MFRSKIKTSLLLLLLLALDVPSCKTPRSSSEPVQQSQPQRIVSISPNVTEILYGVGAWSQVVAVSQFCSYPDDVKNKPRVSGWDKTNLEQITALKPDLVIGVEAQTAFLQDKLDGLGIRSLFLKNESLADVYEAIRVIGKASGHEQQANTLINQTQQEIDAVKTAVAGRQIYKVLCVVDRLPGTIREL